MPDTNRDFRRGAKPCSPTKLEIISIALFVKWYQGVLVAQGGRFAGWSFFLDEGKPIFAYNFLGSKHTLIKSKQKIPIGSSNIHFEFAHDGGSPGTGATGTLFINDKPVGERRIPQTVAYRWGLDETFDVGQDLGTTVVDDADGCLYAVCAIYCPARCSG